MGPDARRRLNAASPPRSRAGMPMLRRVAVVGPGGAGKSTFSDQLGAATGLPVLHLDRLFWKPGWVETPHEEWHDLQRDAVAGDRWIIDGNYGGSLDIRLSRADTVVVFDLPHLLCVRRALWRSVSHLGRSVQADGCPERLARQPQFLRWIWRYPKDSRPRVQAAIDRHRGHVDVVVFTSPGDVAAFLRSATLA